MRCFAPYLLFLFGFSVQAQEAQWNLVNKLQYDNIGAWDVNPMGQIIFSSGSKILLADTNFRIIASQSDRAFGDIKKVDASHSLKTLVFSENQQMIGFLDNTLTFRERKKDLFDLGIDFGILASYSDRSGRFWIYDESNSRLVRFEGLNAAVKSYEITNLAEITGEKTPYSLQESNHELFLFYRGSGVFVFDYYGSLIQKYDVREVSKIITTSDYIYGLTKKSILKINRLTGEQSFKSLPNSEVYDFKITGNYIYLKNRNEIRKYILRM